MNVLQCLSQLEVTGAETYAVTLSKFLRDYANRVLFVSDTLHRAKPDYTIPFNKSNFFQRLKNIKSLRKILTEERINIIHTHSRISSWIGDFAASKLKIAHVTTAHQIFPVTLNKKILPCFGAKVIAISPAIKEHLIRDLNVPENMIEQINNGIDVNEFSPKPELKPDTPVISYIGRLTGPRINVVKFLISIFPKVVKEVANAKLRIVGGKPDEDLVSFADHFKKSVDPWSIDILGYQENIAPVMNSSTAVIGSGRVVMESLACGTPAIAIGETHSIGLLTEKNFDDGVYTNFGDHGSPDVYDKDRIISDIIYILKDKQKQEELGRMGRNLIESRYNIKDIAFKINGLYKEVVKKAGT